jgi:hypothetical protein
MISDVGRFKNPFRRLAGKRCPKRRSIAVYEPRFGAIRAPKIIELNPRKFLGIGESPSAFTSRREHRNRFAQGKGGAPR